MKLQSTPAHFLRISFAVVFDLNQVAIHVIAYNVYFLWLSVFLLTNPAERTEYDA